MYPCVLICRLALVCAIIISGAAAQTGLIVTPQELSLAVPAGSATPATASLSIAFGGAQRTPYTASVRYLGSVDGWLAVSPATGMTPATLTVSANASGLAAGTYIGQVTIAAGGVGAAINVILGVGAGGSGSGSVSVSPSSLTFVGEPGVSALPTQNISVTSAGSPVSFRAIASSSGWLGVSPVPSTTPGTVAVNVFLAGLPAGVLNGSISLIPIAGGSPTVVPVTLISAGSNGVVPAIELSQTAVTITYQTGTADPVDPAVQNINVSRTIGLGTFTASTTTSWLRLTSDFVQAPSSSVMGLTPGPFGVVTDPSGLSVGSYIGTINVSSAGAPTVQLTVTLNVTSTPALNAQPSSVTLTEEGKWEDTVTVTSTGNSGLTFTASATSDTGWLSVTPASGSTASSSGSQLLTLRANTTGLSVGPHNGIVRLTAPNNTSLNIPVRINVAPASALGTLTLSPESVTLTALLGGRNPSQTVRIETDAGTAHNFTAAASSQGGWLQVDPFSGTAPGQLTVTANLAAVSGPGSYTGSVTVTSLVTGELYTVPVALQLAEEAIAAEPTSLSFVQTQRGVAPAPQNLRITANVASNFRIEAPQWIKVSSFSGSTPATISVWPEVSILPPGTNQGTLRIVGPKNQLTIAVAVTVADLPVLPVNSESIAFTYGLGNPVAPSQVIALESPGTAPTSFTATATTQSGVRWLSVTPASGSTPAGLTAAVDITQIVPGSQAGTITITPASGSAQVRTIPVTLTVNAAGASIQSVLHGATLVPTAVAPGQIVTITGGGLGPAVGVVARPSAAGAFDTRLGDTRVLFDGVASPLLFVRSDQINAIVPYALSGRVSTRLQIEQGAGFSLPVELRVADALPGVFTANGSGRGQAAALNGDFTPNSAANPALRGSIISVFGTGEGQTTPAGQDGRVIVTDLRLPLLPVTARIGGRTAQVLYAGSASQLVSGVFQANILVPEDVEPGAAALEIQAGSATSPAGVTIAVR